MLRNNWYFLLLCLLLNYSFCFAQQIGRIVNKSFVVSADVDLYGSIINLPRGFTLEIRGGIIKNGTLVGNQTKVLCSGKAFDHVHLDGTWNVPEISTSMFVDLSYENALKDVISLTNPNVQNTIIIEKGIYQVAAHKNADVCLAIPGNTTLIINGTIRLKPNTYQRCDIIRAQGNNIKISGSGSIVGDKHTHLGTDGEWGMGIRFHGATNSSVRDLTIKDCWGDCIYVGGNSKNILIEKCNLAHGRRQGISVTKADGVTIRNCRISNVSGTSPEYAIDLEPNANDTVDNIAIENVEVVNCEGGFLATIGKKESDTKRIGRIAIKNCIISIENKYPIRMKNSELVSIENCTINTTNEKAAICSSDVHNLEIKDNTINIEKRMAYTLKNVVKKVVRDNVQQPIEAVRVKQKDIRNNRIIEH